LLVVNYSSNAEKEIQGEMSSRPRSGAERRMAGMGTLIEGCGREMCESRARARLTPAESPETRMLEGGICSLCRTHPRRLVGVVGGRWRWGRDLLGSGCFSYWLRRKGVVYHRRA
jgi:hypothetical protein